MGVSLKDLGTTRNLALAVQLACVWEATARKPGNVHRERDAPGLRYVDLLAAAAAIGPACEKAWHRPLGETILDAVVATRCVTATNANLGIVLLLAPLASAIPGRPLRAEVERVLGETTVADAALVYEAIRLAEPGGLGTAPEQDVAQRPTANLRAVMTLAQERDRIARQYATAFADLFDVCVPALQAALATSPGLERAIVATHLAILATFPDSLIARKQGPAVAEQVRASAAALAPDDADAVAAFDAWLTNQRLNPGTTADLVAASLYVALREGIIALPFTGTW